MQRTQPTRYMGIETFQWCKETIPIWTQPTRYMGIETHKRGMLFKFDQTQPTRYMGIETVFVGKLPHSISDTTYSLYGY